MIVYHVSPFPSMYKTKISTSYIIIIDGNVISMVDAFEINSDSKLVDTPAGDVTLDTTKVLVLIDHDNKTVYLWRGKKASLFKKLMGTRVAAKLSDKYRKYRIKPIGEGHEPAAFLELVSK